MVLARRLPRGGARLVPWRADRPRDPARRGRERARRPISSCEGAIRRSASRPAARERGGPTTSRSRASSPSSARPIRPPARRRFPSIGSRSGASGRRRRSQRPTASSSASGAGCAATWRPQPTSRRCLSTPTRRRRSPLPRAATSNWPKSLWRAAHSPGGRSASKRSATFGPRPPRFPRLSLSCRRTAGFRRCRANAPQLPGMARPSVRFG
jgi:hypothetical protein